MMSGIAVVMRRDEGCEVTQADDEILVSKELMAQVAEGELRGVCLVDDLLVLGESPFPLVRYRIKGLDPYGYAYMAERFDGGCALKVVNGNTAITHDLLEESAGLFAEPL